MYKITCPCGKKVLVKPWLVGRKKYCSKVCHYKYHGRRSGLKYVLHVTNPTWFKKKEKPWNNGLTAKDERVKRYVDSGKISKKGKHYSTKTEFKKGCKVWNDGIDFLAIKGDKHFKWKGDDVGYVGLHCWILRNWKKKEKCDFCGLVKKLDWANKNGIYNRNKNNWLNLCRKCHKKYDMENPKR